MKKKRERVSYPMHSESSCTCGWLWIVSLAPGFQLIQQTSRILETQGQGQECCGSGNGNGLPFSRLEGRKWIDIVCSILATQYWPGPTFTVWHGCRMTAPTFWRRRITSTTSLWIWLIWSATQIHTISCRSPFLRFTLFCFCHLLVWKLSRGPRVRLGSLEWFLWLPAALSGVILLWVCPYFRGASFDCRVPFWPLYQVVAVFFFDCMTSLWNTRGRTVALSHGGYENHILFSENGDFVRHIFARRFCNMTVLSSITCGASGAVWAPIVGVSSWKSTAARQMQSQNSSVYTWRRQATSLASPRSNLSSNPADSSPLK